MQSLPLRHVAIAIALTACARSVAPPDACDDGATATTALPRCPRAPYDAGPLPWAPTTCFGPPGSTCVGGLCDTRYTFGLCTTPCAGDADCAPGTLCTSGACLPTCMPGDGNCPVQAACAPEHGSATDARWFCVPACDAYGDPMTCGPRLTGRHCEHLGHGLGDCLSGIPPRDAGAIGAPCSDDDACHNFCLVEGAPATPDGMIGGYCTALARGPAPDAGTSARRGNCPPGSVAVSLFDFPTGRGPADGDAALCFAACGVPGDCRAGYDCAHPTRGGSPDPIGFCAPVDCMDAAHSALPGGGCPVGTQCVRARTHAPGLAPQGACVRAGSRDS